MLLTCIETHHKFSPLPYVMRNIFGMDIRSAGADVSLTLIPRRRHHYCHRGQNVLSGTVGSTHSDTWEEQNNGTTCGMKVCRLWGMSLFWHTHLRKCPAHCAQSHATNSPNGILRSTSVLLANETFPFSHMEVVLKCVARQEPIPNPQLAHRALCRALEHRSSNSLQPKGRPG